jgi:hypothetical protein
LVFEYDWYNYYESEYDDYRDSDAVSGLFGVLDRSIIRNLTLESPVVDMTYFECEYYDISIGAVAGMSFGAQIRDVTVNNPTVYVGCGIDTVFVGGVIGYSMPSDELNSVGLNMSVINGADVYGGEIGVAGGFWYDWANAYIGGIAGANYDSVIGSSAVYGTELIVNSGDEINLLCVGGITGYTSMTDPADYGSCVLNNLSMAVFNIDPALSADESLVGGLCGLVLNDFVVNNLYIGSDYYDLFGDVDNDVEYYTTYNYAYEENYMICSTTLRSTPCQIPNPRAVCTRRLL